MSAPGALTSFAANNCSRLLQIALYHEGEKQLSRRVDRLSGSTRSEFREQLGSRHLRGPPARIPLPRHDARVIPRVPLTERHVPVVRRRSVFDQHTSSVSDRTQPPLSSFVPLAPFMPAGAIKTTSTARKPVPTRQTPPSHPRRYNIPDECYNMLGRCYNVPDQRYNTPDLCHNAPDRCYNVTDQCHNTPGRCYNSPYVCHNAPGERYNVPDRCHNATHDATLSRGVPPVPSPVLGGGLGRGLACQLALGTPPPQPSPEYGRGSGRRSPRATPLRWGRHSCLPWEDMSVGPPPRRGDRCRQEELVGDAHPTDYRGEGLS